MPRIQQIINKNKRNLFKATQVLKINNVKIDSGNTKIHEMAKFSKSYDLIRSGHQIVTETKIRTGKIPDIIVMDVYPPICYEIMHSEDMDSIEKKRKTYINCRIIPLRAEDILKQNG